MFLIRGLHNIPNHLRQCVATIGNFDGVHIGHQALLQKLQKQAKQLNLPSAVILFEPQPQEYFLNVHAKPRLTTLQEKFLLLRQYQIDALLCLSFNKVLAEWDADYFMHTVLKQKLDVQYLLVGDDFRFGHERRGNFQTLKDFGSSHQMTVKSLETVQWQGMRVSSTLVRQALLEADFELAKNLLGRPYFMYGKVIHGDKRGRTLGFATANIALKRLVSPLHGVYAVQVEGIHNRKWNAIANVGFRPTVNGQRLLLEVHIFDFNEDIYNQKICVTFLKKIRDEKRFHSLDALKLQITEDISMAKQFFR